MAFYLKCPACDEWRSHELDDSYRRMIYSLSATKYYERHYQNEHAPIPPPDIVDLPIDQTGES